MPADPASVSQMNDIRSAIIALIVLMLGGFGTLITLWISQQKIYLPRTFARRDEERQAQLDALKDELKNKSSAEQVDIERERMMPRLIESTITMSQSISTNLMQQTQQTAAFVAQLGAHDRQLTANTSRLEEVLEIVEQAVTNIQLLTTATHVNTDHSKAAAAHGEKAAKAAEETLELVKRKIQQAVNETKHDTGELPSLEHVTEPPQADDSAALPKAC